MAKSKFVESQVCRKVKAVCFSQSISSQIVDKSNGCARVVVLVDFAAIGKSLSNTKRQNETLEYL